MPRRIRLDGANTHAGACDLCGTHSTTLITQYRTRNYGTDYSDQWLHPLTPYTLDLKQPPLSLKGQVDGIGYRHWVGLALGNPDGKPEAARVVRHANSTLSALPKRLWCFGFDMDNMKARCWYDAALPLHSVAPEHQRDLRTALRALLEVATDAASLVNKQVKAAQFDRPKDVKSNPAVRQAFWQRTEPRFYAALESLARQDPGDPAVLASVYRRWLHDVERGALDVFDIWVQSVPIEHSNIRRVVEAQADLVKWLRAGKAVKPLWAVIKDNSKEAA
jgi:CRISPR system Cascade subunit CasA